MHWMLIDFTLVGPIMSLSNVSCEWWVAGSTGCAPLQDSPVTEWWHGLVPASPRTGSQACTGELTLTVVRVWTKSGHSQPVWRHWRSLPLRPQTGFSPNNNWGSFEIQRKLVIKYLARQNIFQAGFMATLKILTWSEISLLILWTSNVGWSFTKTWPSLGPMLWLYHALEKLRKLTDGSGCLGHLWIVKKMKANKNIEIFSKRATWVGPWIWIFCSLLQYLF